VLVDAQGRLCLGCHSDLGQGAAAARSRHAAFRDGSCTGCHSPHQAGLAKLMLAPEPDVCVACHKPLGARLASETMHAPADSCSSCHLPHFSGQARLLDRPQQQVCADCHDLTEAAFSTAHLGIDPEIMNCVRCHDPHASKDPRLFRATLHAPFVAGSCEECHAVSGN
jgi:predicted CXXCH cytochrome family protein